MIDEGQFIQGYAKILTQSWEDSSYLDRLMAQPKETVQEVGLPVREDGRVNVIRMEVTGEGRLADQVALWEKGEETGVYQLLVPTKPEDFDPANYPLTDTQLEAVTGGASRDGGGYYCCCCCPCCTCT